MLIDAFVVFCRLHGPFEAISYEVTFGRWPFREEKETRLATWRQLGGLYPRPLPLQTGTDAKLELTLRIRNNNNNNNNSIYLNTIKNSAKADVVVK